MATLLSIETSGALCSLALHSAGRWREHTQNVERMHNMLVLGMLDSLMRESGCAASELDAVAFGAGPGSFTGVRIAAALAQGIAFAADARVLPVSSSLALASEALDRHTGKSEPAGILTISRSRRDAYYLAGFRVTGGAPVRVMDDVLHQGASAPQDPPESGWLAVGDRPGWWSGWEAACPDGLEFLEGCAVRAATVGRIALEAWHAGEGLDAASALPRYVSGDSPWKPQKA